MNQACKDDPIVIALRVDVDFEVGLRLGVPRILNSLAKNFFKATFFVTMGLDSFGKNTKRVRSKSYLKRIMNMNPRNIISNFGFIYVLGNIVGLRKSVPRSNVNILNDIAAKNFELGIHGFDHYWWAENVFRTTGQELIKDFELAHEEFTSLMRNEPMCTGSPNWRTTFDFLEFLDKTNFEYLSETRGTEPCLVLKQDEIDNYSKVQIPITLPCLHEISDYLNTTNDNLIKEEFLSHLKPGLNVWCIHDYYEGLLKYKLFLNIIDEIVQRNIKIISLREVFCQLDFASVKKAKLISRKLPGGRGEVSWLDTIQ